jgi:sporulation protein YlmC with PRC-barrel domain
MTDGGDTVGQLYDADLDDKTLAVRAYLLRKTRGMWQRRGRINPTEVVACGPDLMLIRS